MDRRFEKNIKQIVDDISREHSGTSVFDALNIIDKMMSERKWGDDVFAEYSFGDGEFTRILKSKLIRKLKHDTKG